MAQNIYQFLLDMGQSPEVIARIMESMQRPTNKFENQNVGFRGLPAGMKTPAQRPGYLNPPQR